MKLYNLIKSTTLLAAAAGIWVGASTSANATIVIDHWLKVTQNGNSDLSSQLTMAIKVTSSGDADYLTLTFRNMVGIASDVKEIYIDAPPPGATDSWFSPSAPTLAQSDGVTFAVGELKNHVAAPGLNGNWKYVVSAFADADLGGQPKDGLNGETDWVALTFKFASTVKMDEEKVSQAIGNQQFRVALHIKSIGYEGDSDTYLAVPEPSTVIAGALLLLPFGASAVRILRKNRA